MRVLRVRPLWEEVHSRLGQRPAEQRTHGAPRLPRGGDMTQNERASRRKRLCWDRVDVRVESATGRSGWL